MLVNVKRDTVQHANTHDGMYGMYVLWKGWALFQNPGPAAGSAAGSAAVQALVKKQAQSPDVSQSGAMLLSTPPQPKG